MCYAVTHSDALGVPHVSTMKINSSRSEPRTDDKILKRTQMWKFLQYNCGFLHLNNNNKNGKKALEYKRTSIQKKKNPHTYFSVWENVMNLKIVWEKWNCCSRKYLPSLFCLAPEDNFFPHFFFPQKQVWIFYAALL